MKKNKSLIYKKPSKFREFLNRKGKWVILSFIIFAVVGLVALFVGFGLTNGWIETLKWFGSKWAIMLYVLLGFIAFGLIWFIHKVRMEKR